MLKTIIKREILEYLKSSKFIIGLGIAVVLMSLSTFINIQDFNKRHQDYVNAREELGKDTFYVKVFRPPQILSVLVQGKDRKLGNSLTMTYLNLPARASGYMGEYKSKHHLFMAGFSAVDFSFLVRVVLSLMVIFLAYNTISEEKTLGTLKQVLANRLPRDQVLLGKFIGGMLVVIGSLVISAVVSMLIMLVHPFVFLNLSDWLRILVLIGLSILYLMCFYTLSLFVSVVVNRPPVALLVLLQIWIFLIIILPNMGVLIARNTYILPSEKEIAQQKAAAFQPYEKEFKEVREAFGAAVSSAQPTPPELGARNVELWGIKAGLNHQVDKDFSRRLTNQMNLAQNLSIFSPAAVYTSAVNRLARTGLDEHERFMEGVFRHWQSLIERMKLRYKDLKAYRSATLPEFNFPSESLSQSFLATLPQWIILSLFSLIFFVLAYVKFLKKDVR
jgi:ABC-type transport system involved in multi-copper enzyme maturation permease subunit